MNVIKKILILLLIFQFFLLFPNDNLTAQETKYAGAFLELGIGAKAMAMGGAFTAVANDGSAFYWNPAGAATLVQQEISGMYASLFKSLSSHHHIGYSRPLFGGTAVSLNWIRLTVADIPWFDVDPDILKLGYSNRVNDASTSAETWQELKSLNMVFTDDPLGYSSFTNDAFFLTLAKSYSLDVDFGWQYFVLPIQIPVGVNVKMIRQSLFDQSASGLGFDFGGMLKFGLDDLFDNNKLGKLSFGYALKDVWNTKLTWNTASRQVDRIKRSYALGLSYFQPIQKINGELLFAWAAENRYGSVRHFGLEYIYFKKLAIRFGLDDDQFTAGIGINVLYFNFDYAYKGHELGGSHRISAAIRL